MIDWQHTGALVIAFFSLPWLVRVGGKWLRRVLVRFMTTTRDDPGLEERARTIGTAIRKAVAVGLRIILAVMILGSLGVDTTPIIGLLSAVTFALGFGARTLVGDILAGVRILLQNRIRVGDDVRINGISGVVQEIRLTSVTLIDDESTAHFIACGSIRTVADLNYGKI